MSLSQAETVAVAPEETGGSLGRDAWRRLRRNPVAIAGALLVTLFVVVALLAPWLAPYPPDKPVGQVTPSPSPDRRPSTGSAWTTWAATSSPGCCGEPAGLWSSGWCRSCSAWRAGCCWACSPGPSAAGWTAS
nr:hypothetical protein GCM10020093_026860 [Planobispora longispora]